MKGYTDLEQSRKLAEFLPLKSADMTYYAYVKDWRGNPIEPKWGKPANLTKEELALPCLNFQQYEYIPCWSLAALLGILPVTATLLKDGNISNTGDIKYNCVCSMINIHKWFDNPVDACVAMIERLHKLKML